MKTSAESLTHTPGPWTVQAFDAGESQGWKVIGKAKLDNGRGGTFETPVEIVQHTGEANAHLIAAAPDMLEMLEHVVFLAKNEPSMTLEAQRKLLIIETVITKAKGK